MKPPKVKISDGYTTVEAVMNLRYGLGARASATIARECNKYKRSVYMIRDDRPDYKVRANSILGVMSLAAAQGKKLHIMVEGEDETAETLALRLYSAITPEDTLNMDFDRFSK